MKTKTLILIILYFCNAPHLSSQVFYPQASNLNIDGAFGTNILGGGGISCADFNNDGYDDLTFATENGKDIYFYENKIDHFELVNPPFVSNTNESKQVLWIDYDNDGDKDLFVSAYGATNKLYENDGAMNLTDVTTTVGLPSVINYTYSANFGDLDKDGDLDLYIANHGLNQGENNTFYEFDLSTKTYIDKTISSGLANGLRQSFATVFFDFDMDGDLDIYIANDRLPGGTADQNTLYRNEGSLYFLDVSVPSNSHIAIFAMNTAVADADLDGDFDIYVTNIGQSAYLENNGDSTFSDVSIENGTTFDRYGWGANFLDCNNDRYEDLYVCHRIPIGESNPVNAFYLNNKDGTFSEPFYDSGGLAGIDTDTSFVNAILDYNNDGNQDIIVSKMQDNFELFSNHENNKNNFIKLDLIGSESNINAIGALIELSVNGQKSYFQKHCSTGFQSQHSDYTHLAIGAAENIEYVKVYWPYGNNIDIIDGADLSINKLNVVQENDGLINVKHLDLCKQFHNIQVNPIPSQKYGASEILTSTTIVTDDANVHFQSEQEILLNPGFEVSASAEFFAEIELCGN